jgi:hypothetical protein
MSSTYAAQESQDRITMEVEIEGFENWRDAFAQEVELREPWARVAGKNKATQLEVCDITARLNRTSRELAYLSTLINLGYVLEEAVVTFDTADWGAFGKCTWIKNHETYSDPNNGWRRVVPDASDYVVSLIVARFKTKNAGEQEITLSSVALSSGFLFHKTLRFHRMVFSAQKK